ncbi:MAG: pseudouridine synthase [bacterium]|nr:pseudouridine synthase [bacterium]
MKTKNKGEELVRLNKYIANSGVCSRRKADELIEDGRVRINDVVVTELGMKVDVSDETLLVEVNGKKLTGKKTQFTYIMLHKPSGYVVTKSDAHAIRTIMDLLPNTLQHVHPVGRLDKMSSGLILLTDDGDYTYEVTHPKFNKEKEYIVKTRDPLTMADINKLRNGIVLAEGNTGKNKVKQIDPTTFAIILQQGWNRQIRRMIQSLDNKVMGLKRIRIGDLSLGTLPPGKWNIIKKENIC